MSSSVGTVKIQDLHDDVNLWWKIHVMIFDMRNYQTNIRSSVRLENVLGVPENSNAYFNAGERQTIMSAIVYGTTTFGAFLRQTLDERQSRNMRSGIDGDNPHLCVERDISPIWEKAFGVDPEAMARDKAFIRLIRSCGLNGGSRWRRHEVRAHARLVKRREAQVSESTKGFMCGYVESKQIGNGLDRSAT
ncbi:MAG: exo-1,3-beta-glucanase [Chaenotheca gracillima]|nr:MAG: exo-1,3-beta-glucanase [Chaenotheca gracillima]